MAFNPSSLYSRFDTHIFLNVSREAKIDPPIQVEYNLSCGADILILISLGANFFSSLNSLSPNLLKSVDPPERTTLEKSIRRRSMSDFLME